MRLKMVIVNITAALLVSACNLNRPVMPASPAQAPASGVSASGSSEQQADVPPPGLGAPPRSTPVLDLQPLPTSEAGFSNLPTPGAGFSDAPTPGAGFSDAPTPGAGFSDAPTPGAGFSSAAPGTDTSGAPSTSPTAQQERPTYTVQRGMVVAELKLSGRVAPIQQALAFTDNGILKALYVENGMSVTKGQLLAELELGDLDSQLRQARSTYEQDRVALNRATQAGQIEVRRAEVDLDEAKARLEEARQPAKPEEIAAAQADLQQAQADLNTVKNEASQTKNLAHQDMVYAVRDLDYARSQLEAAIYRAKHIKRRDTMTDADMDELREQRRLEVEEAERNVRLAEEKVNRTTIAFDTARGNEVAAVQKAEAVVANAQAQLEKLLRGPEPFAISEAERAVRLAQIALDAARQRAQPDPELVKRVTAGQFEVQRIEQQIEARRLYAPFDGEVVGIDVAPGMTVQAASPIALLTNNTRREIVADATTNGGSETSRLAIGLPVEITFSRYSDKIFTGTITRAPGRSTSGNPTSPFDTAFHISYNAGDMVLDLGDLAEINIITGRATNVLWLPPAAIRTSRDKAFVTLKDGDTERRVEVQIGLKGSDRVEIVKGLLENDVVYGEVTTSR